jgi:hypothetical protein
MVFQVGALFALYLKPGSTLGIISYWYEGRKLSLDKNRRFI